VTREPSRAARSWLRAKAEALARHPSIRRPRQRLRFAAFAGAAAHHRVLDVAAGPAYNALAFARRAAQVTSVATDPDFLPAGQREAARRRLRNLVFDEGDPRDLPFPDDSFHIVTSSAALHHLPSPSDTISEMARICLPGGIVAIEEIVASEQRMRARYHDRLERLRDRSHRHCLTLSELVGLLGRHGLHVSKVLVNEVPREVSEWITATRTPERRAEHIRRLLQGSAEQDLSGLAVQPADDTFLFVQRIAWTLAAKPA
jgi:SAM-dependent methyltransferase